MTARTTLKPFTKPGSALLQYLNTLLWSECDEDGRSLSDWATWQNIQQASIIQSSRDLHHFFNQADEECPEWMKYLYRESMAHNFALARNHYGARFWYPWLPGDLGRTLVEISQRFPSVYLEAGHGVDEDEIRII